MSRRTDTNLWYIQLSFNRHILCTQLYPKKGQNVKLNLTHGNKEVSFESNFLKKNSKYAKGKKRATKEKHNKNSTNTPEREKKRGRAIKVIPYCAAGETKKLPLAEQNL